MAKLSGVKTVVESIEYNGVRYEKSTEPAEVGDILRMEEAGYDMEEGAFYEVVFVDGDGDPVVVDDVGDEFNLGGEDYTVFKRIVPAPASVQYREVDRDAKVGDRIRIVNAQMTCDMYENGDEFVVTGDEYGGGDIFVDDVATDENPYGFIWREEYVVLEPVGHREGKREARVGERIKIVDAICTFGNYKNGDVLTVTKVDADGVCTGQDGGWPYIYHGEYVVLEPAAEKYSVGDYVKIVGNSTDHGFSIGEIARVTEVVGDGEIWRADHLDGSDWWLIDNKDVVRATGGEIAAARDSDKWAKIGRKVGEIRKGDLVRVVNGCNGKNRAGDVGDALGNGSVGSVLVGTKDNPTGKAGWCVVELVTPVEQRFDTPADAA